MESARRGDRREKSRDRRSPEPDRRKDRRASSSGRHLSRAMSCHPAEDIQEREVMASRHYLSRMPPDRSPSMRESRNLSADRRSLKSIRRTYKPDQSRALGKSREVNSRSTTTYGRSNPRNRRGQSWQPGGVIIATLSSAVYKRIPTADREVIRLARK